MPIRATKRGDQRTPMAGDYDAIICGASFAGLATARELRGSGAHVLLLDRYEIGERATSACVTPTVWLERLGLAGSIRQTFETLTIHAGGRPIRFRTPWPLSTFDYRECCRLLAQQGDFEFETAVVTEIERSSDGDPIGVLSDRGTVRSPLVVDALGWRRALTIGPDRPQPPDAPLSRGLELHADGSSEELQIWIDRDLIAAGYGWSFPAGDELRIGIGSFEPRDHVREPTVRLAEQLNSSSDRFQGNWIPHKLRPAVEDNVFCVGDSAGHCLPLSAEGIRTALYFGIACGRELRSVFDGHATRAQALKRYAAFSDGHERAFRILLGAQRALPKLRRTPLAAAVAMMSLPGIDRRWMNRYLRVAHPDFLHSGGTPA